MFIRLQAVLVLHRSPVIVLKGDSLNSSLKNKVKVLSGGINGDL